MEIEDQFSLDHLLFVERQCRICGKTKDLLSDFYLSRKNKRPFPSAYSYECKECTIKRISIGRSTTTILDRWEYPDW
jgi:hypothetical protein